MTFLVSVAIGVFYSLRLQENTCFKEKKKNKTGEQKLRYFKIDMNDVQLRIWSYAQKLKVLR